jgi:DNA polymerase III alpha subunit (gram-positive type)
MFVCGIDFETQGIDAEQTNPTEVGAILFEVTLGETETWEHFDEYNSLIWEPGYPPQTEQIVKLTGITDAMLRKEGLPIKEVYEEHLFPFLERADIILAHNKKFDKTVLYSSAARNQLVPPEKRWLCTWSEMPYPSTQTCKKLSHLGLDHGLKMDNRELHRAVNDVELMLEIVQKYSIQKVIAYADEPNIIVRALIPAPWTDGGKGKEEATRRGFSWESPRNTDLKFDKCWVKQIKVSALSNEIENASFKIVEIK